MTTLGNLLAPIGIAIVPNTSTRRLDIWRTPAAFTLLLGRWEVVIDRRYAADRR